MPLKSPEQIGSAADRARHLRSEHRQQHIQRVYEEWKEALILFKHHGKRGIPLRAYVFPEDVESASEEFEMDRARLRGYETLYKEHMPYCYMRYHRHERQLSNEDIYTIWTALYDEASSAQAYMGCPVMREDIRRRQKEADDRLQQALQVGILKSNDQVRSLQLKLFRPVLENENFYHHKRNLWRVVQSFESLFINMMPYIWKKRKQGRPDDDVEDVINTMTDFQYYHGDKSHDLSDLAIDLNTEPC
jgi:hypothetical protein